MTSDTMHTVTILSDYSLVNGPGSLHTWIEIRDLESNSGKIYSLMPMTDLDLVNGTGMILENASRHRITSSHTYLITADQYNNIKDLGDSYIGTQDITYDVFPDRYDAPSGEPGHEDDHNCVTFSSHLLEAAGIDHFHGLTTPGEVEDITHALNEADTSTDAPAESDYARMLPDGSVEVFRADGQTELYDVYESSLPPEPPPAVEPEAEIEPRPKTDRLSDIEAPFEQSDDPPCCVDPLVLDLNGNGVELTSLEESSTFFDLDSNGMAEKTGWVTGGDALLAMDLDGDGMIGSGRELFGDQTVMPDGTLASHGFAALQALDSNGDGSIDAADNQFTDLRVWHDANGDGISDAGELATLEDHGVTSISTTAQASQAVVAGHAIPYYASFARSDGSESAVYDVFFSTDTAYTIYRGETVAAPELRGLANLRGYGDLPDLTVAMTEDPELMLMVHRLAAEENDSAEEKDALVEQIIFRWAGTEEVDPTSRGPNIDARKLAVLERLMGRPHLNSPTAEPSDDAAPYLEFAWENFYQGTRSFKAPCTRRRPM